MSGWDSPPPMIVQLRGLLEDMEPVCSDKKQLEMALELVAEITQRYPVLTASHTGTFPTEYAG